MQIADFGPIVQHGFVVEDSDAAARAWAERTGAGPFYVFDPVVLDNYLYRGKPTTTVLKIAIGFWGETQIELIQPVRDDGLYARAVREAPGQLNHYAVYVDDLEALLDRRRLRDRVLQSGRMPNGLSFVYLESYIPGGLHLEIIQPAEENRLGMQGMIAIARNWDGRNPVRTPDALGQDLAALGEGGR